MPDSLTRLLRAVLPSATAAELSEAADRLGSFIESRAAWVGDTAEGAVRKVEDAVLGRSAPAASARGGAAMPELPDRLWEQVMGAIVPTLHAIEARARAARESAETSPEALALARDADWLIGELHAAWAREVALRARRPSGEWREEPGPPGRT
jgi:hypothetical protein